MYNRVGVWYENIICTPFDEQQTLGSRRYVLESEVRHPAIITPVALPAPPQRLVLGPADLARRRVHVALELWRRPLADTAAQRPRRHRVSPTSCGGRLGLGGFSDVSRCRQGGWGWLLLRVRGQTRFGGALEALELGLLVCGQAWGRGSLLEGGRVVAGGRGDGGARGRWTSVAE